MQNKGLIRLFAIILSVVCLYQLSFTWFAKKHTIEYMSQGFLGDDITVITWVESATKISTLRKYHIYRKSDKKLLCKAETLWIMINLAKSRPAKIPQELMEIFDKYDGYESDDITELL